jgi:hypothetical protein
LMSMDVQKRHLGHNGSRNSLYDGVYDVQEFHWARIVSAKSE